MPTNTPYPGGASYGSDRYSADPELFWGQHPAPFTVNLTVKENTDIPAHAVVAYDPATKALTLHQQGSGTPIGITTDPVQTGAGEEASVGIYQAGHFTMQALVFDASYDTDEKKAAAFNGADTPVQILITKADYAGDDINV